MNRFNKKLGILSVFLLCAVGLMGLAVASDSSTGFQLRIRDEAKMVIVPEGEQLVISGIWHKSVESGLNARCTVDGKRLAAADLDKQFEQGLEKPLVLESGVYRFATDTDDKRDLYKLDGGICFFKGRSFELEM